MRIAALPDKCKANDATDFDLNLYSISNLKTQAVLTASDTCRT